MSADLLREAAREMRARAEAATPGPWVAYSGPGGFPNQVRTNPGLPVLFERGGTDIGYAHYMRGHDAAHIAGWHPLVALAVADLLDTIAEHVQSHDCEAHCEPGGCDEYRRAVRVARAFLGTDGEVEG